MDIKEKDLEKNKNSNNEPLIQAHLEETNNSKKQDLVTAPSKEFTPVMQEKKTVLSIFSLLVIIAITIIIVSLSIFTIYNMWNHNIVSGVHIKGLDVSNLSKSDAKYQVENYINQNLPTEIKVKHGDFETTISLSQINAIFDIKEATNSAYSIGRQGNIFQNNLYVLSAMFGYVNIEPSLKLDKEQLTKNLEDISTQLPDKVEESSYYIDGNNLIITSRKRRKCSRCGC